MDRLAEAFIGKRRRGTSFGGGEGSKPRKSLDRASSIRRKRLSPTKRFDTFLKQPITTAANKKHKLGEDASTKDFRRFTTNQSVDIRALANKMSMKMNVDVLTLSVPQHALLLEQLWGRICDNNSENNHMMKKQQYFPDFEVKEYRDPSATWNQVQNTVFEPNSKFKSANALHIEQHKKDYAAGREEELTAAEMRIRGKQYWLFETPLDIILSNNGVNVPHIGRVPDILHICIKEVVARVSADSDSFDPQRGEKFPHEGLLRVPAGISDCRALLERYHAARHGSFDEVTAAIITNETKGDTQGRESVAVMAEIVKWFFKYNADPLPDDVIVMLLVAARIEDAETRVHAYRYVSLQIPRNFLPTVRYSFAFLDYLIQFQKITNMDCYNFASCFAFFRELVFHGTEARQAPKTSTGSVAQWVARVAPDREVARTLIPMWRVIGRLDSEEIDYVKKVFPDDFENLNVTCYVQYFS